MLKPQGNVAWKGLHSLEVIKSLCSRSVYMKSVEAETFLSLGVSMVFFLKPAKGKHKFNRFHIFSYEKPNVENNHLQARSPWLL